MCDYSVHADNERKAVAGDRLVVHKFVYSKGFMPEDDVGYNDEDYITTAVCLTKGTEIVFSEAPHRTFLQCLKGVKPFDKVARFTKVDENKDLVHHDALEFANGQVVLINDLKEGMKATVLQLPNEQKVKARKIAITVE